MMITLNDVLTIVATLFNLYSSRITENASLTPGYASKFDFYKNH
jgi:hypothetical protein